MKTIYRAGQMPEVHDFFKNNSKQKDQLQSDG